MTHDAKNMPIGFMHSDVFNGGAHRVYFIDPKGKDISFDRWRFDLYYANSSAMTHFEQSQEAADAFYEMFSPMCFANYTDFRTTFQRLNG